MARIIVVEPLPAVAQEYSNLVRSGGAEPVVASNGATALRYLRQEKVPLVISARHLPDMSGDALQALLRGMSGTKAEVVVVVSPTSGKAAIEQAVRSLGGGENK